MVGTAVLYAKLIWNMYEQLQRKAELTCSILIHSSASMLYAFANVWQGCLHGNASFSAALPQAAMEAGLHCFTCIIRSIMTRYHRCQSYARGGKLECPDRIHAPLHISVCVHSSLPSGARRQRDVQECMHSGWARCVHMLDVSGFVTMSIIHAIDGMQPVKWY